MENKIMKRILSAILCIAMLVLTVPVVPMSASAASAAGMEAAITVDTEFHDGIDYEIIRTTRYIGNRTYSVQIDISANLSTFEHARIRTSAQNGYVTIQETGYYLLELWGGDGGDGQNGITSVLIPSPGGSGASGGYVYGKVFLKAGQTLVYNIGTNGDESTVYDDNGGGVNGDGGTHGDQGSYIVGGGGGYTSIYLFEENEFQEDYVTQTTLHIPEAARLSRYLMIAGGGGGGGAGFTNLLLNGTAGAPNGGAGGSISNGISMSLLGSNYAVPGYVFSGRNGQSSGTSTDYVGHGGSNIPGTIAETWMGYFQQTQLPNDWSGTYNPATKPGAGGSGNFRGGGGGSGYAGGSGGLMAAQLVAANVGGGGGGSSFIAAEANGQPIVFQELTTNERAYLSGASAQPIGSNTGGAVQITYLSGADDAFYQEELDRISVGATVSKYFDVLSSSKTTGSNSLSITENSDGTTYVKAAGLSVVPTSPAHSGKTATVTLFIRAKETFMGGNSVQLISGISADFLSPNDRTTPIHIVPSNPKYQEYVNVPLNATIQTKSYTSSQKGKAYAVSALYQDDYAGVRDDLTASWQYDHISAISTYRVYNNGTHVTGSVAPSVTTTYEVCYDVTPLTPADAEIKVGPAIESPTTITGKAVISVVEPGRSVLNGLNVRGSKTLNYADGKYTFSTIIDQQSKNMPVGGATVVVGVNDAPDWTAPEDGWYFVQAWGGNGGGTSTATIYNRSLSTTATYTASSASGGDGGYVSTYAYFNKGDVITTVVGSVGSTGGTGSNGGSYNSNSSSSKDTNVSAFSYGGGGGKSTSVLIGDVTILIAGGGGGAGGGAVLGRTAGSLLKFDRTQYKNAVSGRDSTTINVGTTPSGSYNGSSGGNGSASWGGSGYLASRSTSAGSAGSAGASFKNSNFGTTQNGHTLSTAAQKYASETLTTTKTGRAGQVSITLIENAETESVMDTVKGINTKVAFSRYFDVSGVELNVGISGTTKSTINNTDGSKTVTYTHGTYGQVAKFTYQVETLADGEKVITISDCDYALNGHQVTTDSGYAMYYTANLNFSYTLTPRAGFLGGNDVPVLAYGLTGNQPDTQDGYPDCGVKISQGNEFMNLLAADPTDFANVENTVDLETCLAVQDKTIHLGDSVQKTELYTFTPPTYGADAWEDDYATFVSPGDATYTPTQTTDYTITASFVPRITNAQKATIVGSLPAQEHNLTATVYVEVPVNTILTNMTADNEDWTLWGEAFGCTLTPKAGYILPEEIVVTINGEETSNYTYNSSVGTVSIEGQYVTGPIEIQAQAAVQTYDIHILYSNYDPQLQMDVQQPELVITGIQADDILDWSKIDEINSTINPKPGYKYHWVYETADGNQPATMPANNLWVYGTYEKESYLLTINYVKEDGTPVEGVSSYTGAVVFGEDYSVVSPAVKGYIPDKAVVTGTMADGAITITVTYKASQNKLIILYQKATDGTLLDSYEQTTVTGETYTIPSPQFEGYEADMDVVSVTMDGDDTQTVIVNYTPKTYTITFNYKSGGFDEATLDGADTRLVEYDNIYGYNAADKVYEGLPTAQIAGYTFAGWYTDETYTAPVKESFQVKYAADMTLYAKWERTKYKLTVRYEFLYENGDYIPEGFDGVDAVKTSLTDTVAEIPFGEEYSIVLPALTGYSAYENYGLNDQEKCITLTGTMPGQNMLVVISYEINTYTIRFMDAHEAVSYDDAATSPDGANDTSFNEEKIWQTIYVKHNVAPVYTEQLPTHGTTANYTYAFSGWYGNNDSRFYGDGDNASPEFPAATDEQDYYAAYEATENIVSIGSDRHFVSVKDALAYADANLTSGFTMTFRRNTGNGSVVNLNDDTIQLNGPYTGTVTVDLNGKTLTNTLGQPIVENTEGTLNVTIKDSSKQGAKIAVSKDDVASYTLRAMMLGQIAAIESSKGSLTINDEVLVEAVSNTENATAIHFSAPAASYSLSLGASVTVKAEAANGTAVGIDVLSSTTVKPAQILASGQNAIAIRANEGTTLTLSAASMGADIQGAESAVGVYITEGATLVNTTANTVSDSQTVMVESQGNAYGILNEGTVESVNLAISATAEQNAYGLYNNAGTVTVSGVGVDTDLRATGAEGYGLYNVAESPAIGAEDGDKLSSGAFAGSSYGIYSEEGSVIYAIGNKHLYFKGADEETALSGVVHKYQEESYEKTNAEEGYEKGDDYFRLAAEYDIIFMDGDKELEKITKFYNEPFDLLELKKSGYTFVSWNDTETLDSVYDYQGTVPENDLILYAKWDLNQYKYALDMQTREYTIKFYQNKSSTDTSLFGEVVINADNPTLTAEDIPVKDPTYISGTTLYIFNGWYSQRTDTSATYVKFDGDLGELDKDGDCIIEVYAGWESMGSTQSFVAFDTTAATANVNNTHSSSKTYKMYFVVPADGDYSISVGNVASGTSSSYKKDLRIFTYKHGTKSSEFVNSYTNYGTSLSYVNYTSSSYSGLRGLKAGDVVVVQLYYYSSSYSSTVYSKVSAVPSTYSDVPSYEAYATTGVKPIDYNVEMGTVQLLPPENDKDHEGMKFAGWAESAESDRIVQITPDMVDTVPQWQNGEVWQLYSQWTERTWASYQSGQRDFSAFGNVAQANIRGNGTVSIRFCGEQMPTNTLSFKFANGLPAGTVLTLIDRSGAEPVYYTYTTKALTKELSSTAFVKMGVPGQNFSGIGTDLVLQICYQNASVGNTSETVSIYAGDIVSEEDAAYGITPVVSVSMSNGSHAFSYDEEHIFSITIDPSSVPELGLPDDYKVFLRVRWDELNLAPGSRITLGDVEATIHDGEYALLDTGLTIKDMKSNTINADVHIYLPTMVQNEFSNKNFYYELCVAPDGAVAFGKEMESVLSIKEVLSLEETPSLTVDEVEKTVSVGQTVSVNINSDAVTIYLYQQNSDGTFACTANCATVFQDLTIDADGKLSATVENNVFNANVSEEAVRGKYYLVVKRGDKYERILLKLVAGILDQA